MHDFIYKEIEMCKMKPYIAQGYNHKSKTITKMKVFKMMKYHKKWSEEGVKLGRDTRRAPKSQVMFIF